MTLRNKATDAKLTIGSSDGSRIEKLRVRGGRYLIAKTNHSLIVGDIDCRLLSEISLRLKKSDAVSTRRVGVAIVQKVGRGCVSLGRLLEKLWLTQVHPFLVADSPG